MCAPRQGAGSSPVPREVDPGCGFVGAAQPRGHSLAPTDSISPGAFIQFFDPLLVFQGLGRAGEQQMLFLAWCPACFSARECLHPAVLVLWHPSSTPKPEQSGLESRPEMLGRWRLYGHLSDCDGMCWTHLHWWSGSSSDHILPLLLSSHLGKA